MARPAGIARRAIALAGLVATPALAGPPFLTDDPVPTPTGHWEVYAPLVEGEGAGTDRAGSIGAELNYGAARNVQITLGLPLAYAHDAAGTRWGAGDADLSVKYRFLARDGLSIAVFPALTLPTAAAGLGSGRVTAFLPVWVQQDAGPWSVFGGGGYAINPGPGNRSHWRGALAVSRQLTPRLLVGVEAERQGADAVDGRGVTRLGIGTIYQLKAPFRLLASAGPAFADGDPTAGFHAFAALGLDF